MFSITMFCSRCRQYLASGEFSREEQARQSKRCRACYRAEARRNYATRKTADPVRHKASQRRLYLKSQYGISDIRVESMRRDQNDACAICRQQFASQPHIDHDHASGSIRGLLCGQCNQVLGLMKDDPLRLIRAAEYLIADECIEKKAKA